MSDSSGIAIELFWEVLKRHFEEALTTDADTNELVLALNDVKDVEQLLQEVVYECSQEKRVERVPFLHKITEFMAEQSWQIGAHMTWEDFKKLAEHVEPWKVSETGLDLALRQSIQRRVEEKQFPPVMPTELNDRDQQAVAENLLALVDEDSKDKLLTYILSYSRTETTEENGSADWILGLYETMYKHVRIWIFTETLKSHVFPHRHHNRHFLPLVPPQILKSTEERANAVDVVREITPDMLPLIEKALWQAWEECYTVLEMVGMPAESGFSTFLEKHYYSVLSKMLQEKKDASDGFVPLVPTDMFASGAAEKEKRDKIVRQASKKDGEYAEMAMKRDIAEKVDTLNETQKQLFLQTPINKNKFAVECYFQHLARRVRKRDGSEDLIHVSGDSSQEAKVNSLNLAGASALENLIAGVSGPVKGTENQPEQKCEYEACLDICTTVPENSYINFQGVLVCCDTEARQVGMGQIAVGKRKQKAHTSTQLVKLILVDQTGPIQVQIWGDDLGDTIINAWSRLQTNQASPSAERAPHIVDLQRVRVQAFPKSDWNGDCLTRMRFLRSVENFGANSNATTVTMLTQPTSFNLLERKWMQPPLNVCISKFQTIKNKLRAPFRITLSGVISDVKPLDITQNGNTKETFFN